MRFRRVITRSAVRLAGLTVVLLLVLGNAEAFRDFRGGEVVEGRDGGAAVFGMDGRAAVRGPDGNIYYRRAVGARVDVLPDSVSAVNVGGQVYYVDGTGAYYQPCEDDSTVYCVVPDP